MDNQPAPIPSTFSQPSTPVIPANRPRFLLPLAMLAILTLGIALGVFASKFLTQSQIQPQLPPTPTPTPITIATPTPDPTAGWKTYTNEKYGYSLKYPPDVFLRLICPGEELTLTSRTRGAKDTPDPLVMPTCARGGRYDLEIVTSNSPKEKPKSNQIYSITEEDAIVDKIKTRRYIATLITKEPCPGCAESFITILVNHNNKTYEIYYDNSNPKWILDLILSTFKFTD